MYGDAKCTLAETAGFTGCGIDADAPIGIAETVNGFETSDAACEVSTFDGAPVHLNAGRADCETFDVLGEVIALIVPSTTALAVPRTPAAAIDSKSVTALTAELGVCIPANDCTTDVTCGGAAGVTGTVVVPIADGIRT